MARRSSRIEDRLIKSVVIVGETRSNDYCIGLVARVDSNVTFVLTQSSFVEGKRDRLKVCFFDKTELPASVVGTEGQFCLLRTAHHPFCQRVQWAEDRITSLSQAVVFLPTSSTTLSSIHIPVTLESAQSYGTRPTDVIVGSDNLFLVACPYIEKTFDGSNRLVVAPIFALDERALGIVIFDCCCGYGADEMKVCLLARRVMALISRLIPPAPPPKAKRRGVDDGSKDKKKGKKMICF